MVQVLYTADASAQNANISFATLLGLPQQHLQYGADYAECCRAKQTWLRASQRITWTPTSAYNSQLEVDESLALQRFSARDISFPRHTGKSFILLPSQYCQYSRHLTAGSGRALIAIVCKYQLSATAYTVDHSYQQICNRSAHSSKVASVTTATLHNHRIIRTLRGSAK